MTNCTVSGCERRHYATGLCRRHYMQRKRAMKKEEQQKLNVAVKEQQEKRETKQILLETRPPLPKEKEKDTKTAYVTTLPFSSDTIDPKKIGIGEKSTTSTTPPPAPGPAKPFQFNIGIEFVEMGYEYLNAAAPNSRIKLKLTEIQKANLEAAFAAVGIGTQNPWVVIVLTIIPPVALFVILNYDELKIGLGKIFGDMKKAVVKEKVFHNSLVGVKDVSGHTASKPAAATG